MNPSVSVIISTYNRPQTLSNAIKSALEQTYTPLEILICDDGFDKNTKYIVDNFNNSVLKYIPGTHSGRPAPSRNRGIRESTGDWVAFLDDDDIWLPDKLETQIFLSSLTGSRAICSNAWRTKNGNRLGAYFLDPISEEIRFPDLFRTNSIICSSALVHKSIFSKVDGFPEEEGLCAVEDFALWFRVLTITRFIYSPQCLLEYNDDPSNSIRANQVSINSQRKNIMENFSCWAKKSRKHFYVMWSKRLANKSGWY